MKPGFRYSRMNCSAFRSRKFARHFCLNNIFPQSMRRIRRRCSAIGSQGHFISFLQHTSLYTREISHLTVLTSHVYLTSMNVTVIRCVDVCMTKYSVGPDVILCDFCAKIDFFA